MLCFLFSAIIVLLDQIMKWYVRLTITVEGASGPDIFPGLISLTRIENNGAMLGFLSGQWILLAAIAFIASIVLVMILLRYNEGFWGTLGLSAVLGGTVGNLCDRIFNRPVSANGTIKYGAVTDMFRTEFWDSFPIYNIADIFITLGFVTFLIHFVYLTIKPQGLETSAANAAPSADSPALAAQPAAARPQNDNFTAVEALIAAQVAQATETSSYAADGVAPPVDQILGEYSSITPDISSQTDTTPDISFTLEALEAELGSLDVGADYDIDELLREYGLEDDVNL